MTSLNVVEIVPFGCRIDGVDLAAGATPALADAVVRLLHTAGFALFRDQVLDDAQQIAFASQLGKLSGHNPEDRHGLLRGGADGPRLQQMTNREGVGQASELPFHSDNAHAEFPIRYLMLYALDVTTDGKPLLGGETQLANAADALKRLPQGLHEQMSRLSCRLRALGRSDFVRPCIERHWATGRPYLVPSHLTESICGIDPARSEELTQAVTRIIYDAKFLYRHQWREGDLLVWDNRLLHHARSYYDNAQTRVLRRCAIADDLEPEAIDL